MLRKKFIKSASLLIGGGVLAPYLDVSAKPLFHRPMVPAKLKKGLGFGMIQEDLSLLDKFKLVRDLGFDGIEFNSPVEHSLEELLEARDKTGISLPSVVNKDHWSKPLSDPDPSVRAFTVESVARSLRDVRELGGDTVLVVPGVVNEKVSYEQAYKNSLSSIRELIPHVEKTGVRIGIENVWNNFILSPIEAKRFLDEIDHPLIGWYFDIGNILRYGWPEHWIEVLRDRIFKLHVKEFSRKKMNDEGLWKGFDVPLLKGDNNWSAIMKSLREAGYSGEWFTAEVKGGNRDRLREVSQQMDEINNL